MLPGRPSCSGSIWESEAVGVRAGVLLAVEEKVICVLSDEQKARRLAAAMQGLGSGPPATVRQ